MSQEERNYLNEQVKLIRQKIWDFDMKYFIVVFNSKFGILVKPESEIYAVLQLALHKAKYIESQKAGFWKSPKNQLLEI